MESGETIQAHAFLLNGKWQRSSSGRTIEIHSPSKGIVGAVQAMTQAEFNRAAESAKTAQKEWAKTSLDERAQFLYAWADELENQKEEISQTIMQEVGKGRSAALKEVLRTVDFIKYTAEEGKRVHGDLMSGGSFDAGSANKMAMVNRDPVGVVLAISPFNYPVNLAASKIAPALMSGNGVLFKPATQGAISGTMMIQALDRAGLPDGLVNLITGKGSEIGDYIVKHPLVDFINFTGGSETGKNISKQTSMVPVILELGGKDPAIVLEDADLDKTAKEIVSGAFSYSGQRCTAIKRVLVKNEVADKLVQKITKAVQQLKVGSPEDDAAITPLIDNKAADFVQSLIDDALKNGAQLITGNKREENLLYPTLIDHVSTDMRIAWEEPFGPVLPVIRISDEKQAIEVANKSEYGLQASIFTSNIEKALQISSELEAGSVQINGKTERGPDHFPFLGVKNSGLGVQGIRNSIFSMTREKVTVLNIK
ncbi:MAG TPA: NADP-dependent glyceraldehyde-3-phosphate dehydrogenase [Bacillales bacterium]